MSVEQIKEWSKLDAYQRAKAMHDRINSLNPGGMKLRTFEEKMRLYPEDFCPKAPDELRDADGWATHALEYGPGRLAKIFLSKQYCIFCGHEEVPIC